VMPSGKKVLAFTLGSCPAPLQSEEGLFISLGEGSKDRSEGRGPIFSFINKIIRFIYVSKLPNRSRIESERSEGSKGSCRAPIFSVMVAASNFISFSKLSIRSRGFGFFGFFGSSSVCILQRSFPGKALFLHCLPMFSRSLGRIVAVQNLILFTFPSGFSKSEIASVLILFTMYITCIYY